MATDGLIPSNDDQAISGFAAMPHALCADPGLTDSDYRVLGALIRFARDRPGCYPSNAAIGAAAGDKKIGAVTCALRNLERLGFIRRIIDPATQHRTGIELAWDRLATPSKNGGGPRQKSDSPPQNSDSPPSENGGGPPQNSEGLYEEEAGEESSSSSRGARDVPADYPRTVEAAEVLAEEFFPGLYVGQKIRGFVRGYGLEWTTDALFCAHASAGDPARAAGYMNKILMGWRRAGGPPAAEVVEARAAVLRLHGGPRRDAPRLTPAQQRSARMFASYSESPSEAS